jgi:hypothetical protein
MGEEHRGFGRRPFRHKPTFPESVQDAYRGADCEMCGRDYGVHTLKELSDCLYSIAEATGKFPKPTRPVKLPEPRKPE